ncbi:MAG: tyrosine-type recombinase/integrase [Magnetococcales bacterium]|nr:tyrosine-type recombinase/integrase [Magnetococcales bacterium]
MVDGQRIHRIIGKESEGTTRKQAEDFIEQSRADARKDQLNLPKGRKMALGFSQAADNYLKRMMETGGKNLINKEPHFRLFLKPFFGTKPISTLSTFDIERYKKHRQNLGRAPGTINRELQSLRHLYSKAVDWGWVTHRPFKAKNLPGEKNRITYLTKGQASRLMDLAMESPDQYLYQFVRIGLETGMRAGEIMSIRIENVDIFRHIIRIPNPKEDKSGERLQPITQGLTSYLKDRIQQFDSKSGWLFPSPSKDGAHRKSFKKSFRTIVEKANLDPALITPHIMRHTVVTHLVQGGVDLPTVQKISGHKNIETVLKYTHQDSAYVAAAMDILEDRVGRKKA